MGRCAISPAVREKGQSCLNPATGKEKDVWSNMSIFLKAQHVVRGKREGGRVIFVDNNRKEIANEKDRSGGAGGSLTKRKTWRGVPTSEIRS